jgi:hypothetical protein
MSAVYERGMMCGGRRIERKCGGGQRMDEGRRTASDHVGVDYPIWNKCNSLPKSTSYNIKTLNILFRTNLLKNGRAGLLFLQINLFVNVVKSSPLIYFM